VAALLDGYWSSDDHTPVLFEIADFNGADTYLAGAGAAEWADLEAAATDLPLCLQASGQRGIVGRPIFDPKETNRVLTEQMAARGWKKILVPEGLRSFGMDWDGGKNATLGEWQFSNYPFLWNNVIRSEAVFKQQIALQGLNPIAALVIITKSGSLPASNSTLYFEQANAQLQAAAAFNAIEIPIRLVGLRLPAAATEADVVWTVYQGRTARAGVSEDRVVPVTWRGNLARFEDQNNPA
jgi:hypothetical protein